MIDHRRRRQDVFFARDPPAQIAHQCADSSYHPAHTQQKTSELMIAHSIENETPRAPHRILACICTTLATSGGRVSFLDSVILYNNICLVPEEINPPQICRENDVPRPKLTRVGNATRMCGAGGNFRHGDGQMHQTFVIVTRDLSS